MQIEQQQPVPPPAYDSAPGPAPKRRWRWPVVLAIVLAGVLGIGGCSYLVYNVVGNLSAEFKSVGDAVLGKITQGAYGAVWDEAAPELQATVSRAQLVRLLQTSEAQVGKPVSWKVMGFNKQASAVPPRNFTAITFAVTHEHGASTTVITVDKDQRLLGINFDWQ